MIVGPHGAGLSNMVVSPLHTMILEIGPIDCPACYVTLAIKVGGGFTVVYVGVVLRMIG